MVLGAGCWDRHSIRSPNTVDTRVEHVLSSLLSNLLISAKSLLCCFQNPRLGGDVISQQTVAQTLQEFSTLEQIFEARKGRQGTVPSYWLRSSNSLTRHLTRELGTILHALGSKNTIPQKTSSPAACRLITTGHSGRAVPRKLEHDGPRQSTMCTDMGQSMNPKIIILPPQSIVPAFCASIHKLVSNQGRNTLICYI